MAHQEHKPLSTAAPRFFYGYVVVAISFIIMVVIWGAYNAFGVLFKPMLAEFGWTRAMTSGAFSLAWLIQGFLGVFIGRLNDRLGPRIVMTLSGFFIGLGYLLMSWINTVWQFYVFYGLVIGMGMAGAYVPLTSTTVRWFLGRRSMMTGIVTTGGAVGILLLPPMTSHFISLYDWRVSCLILGGIVLVIVLVAAQFLKGEPSQAGLKPYGQERKDDGKLIGTRREFSLKEAVKTRPFWMFAVNSFCLGFVAWVLMVHIAPHVTDLGMSEATAATVLATVGGFSVIGRLGLGILADRIENRKAYFIGFIMLPVAFFALMPATELWMFYLIAALFGFGWSSGILQPPMIAELFGLNAHGLILGVATLGYTIGGAVGPLVGGYIFDVTHSYQLAFLLCGIVAIIGAITVVYLKPAASAQDPATPRR